MPSIYNSNNNSHAAKILSHRVEYPFIIQTEEIDMAGCVTVLDVVYTFDDFYYVGDLDQMNWLIKCGITEQLQPASGDHSCTCSIGFNPTEQKYFGWSHRASYGFGIGSKVKFGDCAYKPKDIEDFNRYLLDFWSVDDGVWRECENETVTCTTILVSIDSNTVDPQIETVSQIAAIVAPDCQNLKLGTLLTTKTIFRGADREFMHADFNEYPDQFGKGEWIAETLEDAKEMAKDFAEGVS